MSFGWRRAEVVGAFANGARPPGRRRRRRRRRRQQQQQPLSLWRPRGARAGCFLLAVSFTIALDAIEKLLGVAGDSHAALAKNAFSVRTGPAAPPSLYNTPQPLQHPHLTSASTCTTPPPH